MPRVLVADKLEASQFSNTVRTAGLAGVTLVLDAGHGGRDTGAIVDGLEEAAYVYDIACRVERLVKSRTRARLVPTVARNRPCPGGASDAVGESRSARVLTTPPYPIEDAAIGVNFRWYLANAVFKDVRRNGSAQDSAGAWTGGAASGSGTGRGRGAVGHGLAAGRPRP